MNTADLLAVRKHSRILTLANVSYVAGIAGLFSILPLSTGHILWGALSAAILCGWSELNGRCGMSHIGALTPLLSWNDRTLWLRAILAYTTGGLVSASCVGMALGSFAALLDTQSAWFVVASAISCLVLLMRELGWIRFPLPQIPRQTVRGWAHQFGFVTAAAMWGGHIGIGFATVVKHGGFFAVVLACLLLGPARGAAIMAAYWVGRTLPLWLAPLLSSRPDDGASTANEVHAHPNAYRFVAAVGLAGLAVLFIRQFGIW